jgi:Domain of unknown function (DUF4276)
MTYSTVYLAAEDIPGLAVGRKLIAEAKPLTVYREENARGNGRLKKNVKSYDEMGRCGLPVLMLTDLDSFECATALKNTWLKHDTAADFLFRICVREVEAWLLGHCSAMAELLRIPMSQISSNPEQLADPKAELIRLAQRSPAKIRKAITPVGTSSIGPGYNDLFETFIRESWVPEVAAKSCPSLEKTRRRIAELADRVSHA